MNKEEELFQKWLVDLADRALSKGITLYSDFMNLNELNIFHSSIQKFSYINWKTFGGYELAERQMAAFIPDAFSLCPEDEIPDHFPISCLQIAPLNQKFADVLNHRDYLGAILNLGIERSKIGDILVTEQSAYLFCCKGMSEFICKELTRIKHTVISCKPVPFSEFDYSPKTEIIKGSVASIRLDALLALAFKTSRSSLVSLIEAGKIFVNGKMITSNGYTLKEGDLISARGYGRFRYASELSQSKKGRTFVEIEKYI